MIKKLATFVILTVLVLPFASFAQSPAGSAKSIQDINLADVPENSMIMLSQDDTGVPGYVHQKYAFLCEGGALNIVDHYGSPITPNEPSALRFERQMCAQQEFANDGSENE